MSQRRCQFWQEYQSIGGPICYCEVEAFGRVVSPEGLKAAGCTLEKRSECLKLMESTTGAGRVPSNLPAAGPAGAGRGPGVALPPIPAAAPAPSVITTIACDAPPQVATNIVGVAEKKARLQTLSIVVLGILAGAYIAFGAELSTVVTGDLQRYLGDGITRLVAGLAFSVGLILVVVGGAELFTGNNLMITGVLQGKVSGGQLLRNWVIVYLANFAGSLLLVYIMYETGIWKTGAAAVGARAVLVANGKVGLTWGEAFARGILCNWLVCLAVWLAAAGRDGVSKIMGIVFPITAFVASGFEHSVANMYFIPMGIIIKSHPAVLQAVAASLKLADDPASAAALAAAAAQLGNLTWSGFFLRNLMPVTLGNIVGGAGFVGCVYWVAYLSQARRAEMAASRAERRSRLPAALPAAQKVSARSFPPSAD